LGHAEMAHDLSRGIAAVLGADDHAGRVAEARQAADDRGVVGEGAVAVQLLEMREQHLHIVQRVGPLRMASDLRHLPGRQLAVDVLGEGLAALGEPLDLLGDVDRGIVRHVAQLLDALLQLGDRLLEFEERGLHRRAILADRLAVSILPATDRASATGTRSPPSATAAMSCPAWPWPSKTPSF